MDRAELALARGRTLEILRAHLDRERSITPDSSPVYMIEDLLLTKLAFFGHPMLRGELSGSVLTYLKDAGLVEYKVVQPAGARGPTLLMWRITHDGIQVFEGIRSDPGVRI